MVILKIIGKFIKVLRSSAAPAQIAWGFALGSIIGLTPLRNLHNLLVVILIVILNVNISAAMLAFLVYSLFAWLLDPLFHSIGYVVLVNIAALQPLWTSLYNATIAPFMRFNNTVVMGSVLFSLIALAPNYFAFKWFVKRYRESWSEKIKKWKITKMMMGSKIVKYYLKIRDLGE